MAARSILSLLVLLFALSGCYDSNSNTGKDTADDRTDTVDTADIVGDRVDDRVDVEGETPEERPDLVPDGEVGEDIPPAQYTLHEWGVMVMDETGGGTMHGPSPDFAGAVPAKPVLYLYSTDLIEALDIRIGFASGASTETWPPVSLGPSVEWSNLSLLPGACTPTPFPSPWDPGDPPGDGKTCEACALGSSVVEEAACLSFPYGERTVFSKLLFYTGRMPDYAPPLSVSAGMPICEDIDCVRFDVTNNSDAPVEGVWLIYRQTQDACVDPSLCPLKSADVGFKHIESIGAGAAVSETLAVVHYEVPVDEYGYPIGDLPLPEEWKDLGKGLSADLVERGLTEKESGAFLANWETVFFGLLGSDSLYVDPLYTNGAIIVHFMSRAEYDEQLPLTATPAPVETARVGMVFARVPVAIP